MRNFLLLVMMLVTTVANAANLLSKQYIGQVYYNIYDDGTAEATYGTLQSPENYSGDIQIRSKVQLNGKDYTVTAIGEDAFYACIKMTSVNIPNTVKSIGNSAFYGTGITEIDIPNSVTTIADNAFKECRSLKSVSMTNSVTSIGSYAFHNCVYLEFINLSENITEIKDYTFYNCVGLQTIEIPGKVTSIGSYAFYNCDGLQTIEIPGNVTSIGSYAFDDCYYLESIKLPENLKTIGEYAFRYCSRLKSIEIPNSVTSIGTWLFAYCYNLENVKLSNSIKTIPERCFYGCSKLLSVTIPNSVTSISGSAFSSCSKLGSITIPGSVTSITSSAFSGCSQCIVYLCNNYISPSNSAFSSVKKVVSCDNVPMPVEINYAFFYTGKEQLYNIPEHSAYSVTGNRRTEEGTQKVTISLKDGFTWTNGTNKDLVFDFTIYPAKFTPEQTLINAYLGQKLKDLTLPKGCKWIDSPETVLEYTGENKFSVYYTPDGWTKAPLIIEMTVMVAKIAVENPLKDTSTYVYDGKSHTYQFTETDFYKVTNPDYLTRTDAGTSYIYITLKNKAKYMWSNGTTSDLSYPFVIKKQTVKRPEKDATEFVYTGKELTYTLDENPLYTISNNVQTNIGSYSVLVSLNDQTNYMWDNGSSSNQTYSFIINKNGVKIPDADTRMFMYTGELQTYNIPENDLYTVKNNVQTNVGNYTVTVSLKDKDYYRWSDGTSTDKTYKFNIEKLKVVVPPVYNGSFTYTGKPQTYPIASNDAFVTVIGYDSNTGKTGADSIQTNAGTYYVVLSLKDKTNSMWVKNLSDTYGNSGNQTYTFTINPADVTSYPAGMSPNELTLETTYGKTLKDITLPSGYVWVSPTTSVGNVGEKTFAADYTPKDSKNYLKTRVDLTVNVKPQLVAEPKEDQTPYYYIAKAQKYGLSTSDLYTVSNNVQTNVGSYDVIVSLKDKVNYAWKTSESADDLTYKFTISKSREAIFESGYNPNQINPKVQYGQKLGEVTLPTRFSWKNPETVATKIGDNKYVVIYTPSDPDNYNSIETEIVVNVTKRKVAFPAKDSRMFVYNGEAQTYEVGSDDQFEVSNNVQTNAGRYDVIVALKDKEHYEWQDGTTDDIYQDFIIRTKSVEMPLVDSKSFVYDGKSHSLTIPASSDYTVSGNKGTDAGRYEVSISLADKKNYVWENNTSADIVASFSISKIKVDMPAADNSIFSYTGEPQTYKIEASDLYTVSGNVQTMAGSYSVKVALNNPRNYEWVDGSTDNLVYNFYIKGLVNQSTLDIVNIPSVAKRTFVYDENIHTLSLENTEKYTVVDEGGINVGRYSATLSLTDKSKYVWENGSSDDVTISYVITKAPVAIPAKDARTYTYNKRNQTYTILKDARYTISNNVQMNAGRYEVKVSLADSKNYEWEDGSSDDITYIFKIGKATVSAPTADGTKFTFTGKPQTYTIVKNALYTVSNNVQTNVGTYDVIVSLADPKNYMWSDGTSNDLSYNFVIRAEQSNITIVSVPTVTTRSFVYDGSTQTLAIPESENYIITNNKRVNAGRYVATVTLRDPINTVWSDGTKEDIQYVFNITKAVVDIPEIDHTRFVYTGKEQTYNIPSSEFYTISGQSQTKVGQHEVVVSLNDVKNYMWSDGTVDDLSYSFVIRAEEAVKTEVAIPAVADNKFEYNGKVQTLDIKQSEYYNVFNNKGVEVGRYTVTLSLVDPETTVWSNGSADDVLLTFVITKAKVDFPAADYTQYTYNGDYQTYDIKSTSLYSVYNEEQIEAGRYEVGVALNDPKNYEWEDGTFADLSYSFLIGKAQVDEPKADQTKFIYDGKAKTYNIAASPLYTTYGTTQTLPGKYEVIVALNDSRNYEWSNGTIDDLIYNFVIRSAENSKKAIEIPTVLTNNFVYDGTAKSLAIAANTAYKVTGNSGVAAGRYTVTLSLTDPKTTVWSDGSTEDIKMYFNINRAQIEIPAADNSKFIYDGKTQVYSIKESTAYAISNNKQINAGRYEVAVSLKDAKNYEWADGSIDDLKYNFVIGKSQVEVPAADNSKFVYNGKIQTYNIASSLLYTVEGNKQQMPGKYEVLVSLVDSKNYEWSNGTTDVLSYNFVIRAEETELTPVEIPTVTTKNFIYDGTVKSLEIASNKNYTISDNEGVDAGRYTVTLSLVDPKTTVWIDGSKDDIKMTMSIAKAQVKIPAADNRKFIYDNTDKVYELKVNDKMVSVDNNIQVNAGRYEVTASLNDPRNYEWEDGSVDDLTYNFVIGKSQVEIPAADDSKFVYNGDIQTYNIASSLLYTVDGNKKQMPGKYEVLVSLVDSKNYEWSNGTTEPLSYNFVIRAEEFEKTLVEIPTVSTKNFIYDGDVKSLKIASDKNYTISGNEGVDAGRYTVTLSLVDPAKTIWSDGSIEDVKIVFTIAKAQVEKPVANNSKFIYDGLYKVYTLKDSSVYTISNNKQINAGRYDVTVALNDAKNYEWTDGSVDDLKYNFTISKAQVEIPAADQSKFVYTGKEQTYKIATSDQYTVAGNKQTLAGRYEVLVSLNDTKNYEWENGTVNDLVYNFTIRAEELNKTVISIPTVSTKNFIYDGTSKSLKIASDKNYTITGNKGVNAGRYTVTLSLVDPAKTVWSDGSTEDVNIVFTIAKAQVEIPAADGSKFVYTGKDQIYSLRDSSIYTISNNKQVNAGRYEVTVALKDAKNYEWENGTIDDLNYNFVIGKAQVEIPAADESKFVYNGKPYTYKIAESTLYTIEGNKQTMPGKYEVLVSLKDVKNYEWTNGTTDVLSYNFVIRAEETELKSIAIPSVLTKNFIYDGKEKSLSIASDTAYKISGNSGVNAGRYTVTLALTDPTKTVWSDGSTDDVKIVMTIAKAQVEKPAADNRYFVYDGNIKVYGIDWSNSDIIEAYDTVKYFAGRYVVTVALKDAKNYEWSDGTVDDLKYSFVINKAQVDIPAADPSKFIYDGEEKTYHLYHDYRYTVSDDTVKTKPGKYEVLVSLNDTRNYEWSNGTIETLTYNFVIRSVESEMKTISIPSVLAKNFIYDGKEKSLAIAPDSAYKISGNSGVDAGRYTVTLSLTDPTKTIWSDGSTDDVKIVMTIAKAQIDVPAADTRDFVFNQCGSRIFKYSIADSSVYTIKNKVQNEAGHYNVIVSLNDTKNYEWSDGSVDNLSYSFVINKEKIKKLVANDSVFVYNGKYQRYELPMYMNHCMNVADIANNYQKEAGRYEVKVSLVDTRNFEWEDGTVDNLSYNFVIRKQQVEMPEADPTKFIYNEKEQTYKLVADTLYTIEGNKQTMPGKYEVLVSLVDSKNYEWTNGTTEPLSYNFVIRAQETELTPVAIPSVATKDFIYDGEVKSLKIAENKNYKVSGNKGVDAGRYTVTLALTDPTKTIWSDGSVDDIKMSFTIAKAQVEKPATNDSVYVYNTKYQTYEIYDYYTDSLFTVSNNVKSDAGKYVVKIALKDAKNYEWADGSIDDLSYNFTINKAQVSAPAADNTKFIYTGKEQTYKLVADTLYTIEGNKQTMPGKYEVLVSLVDSKNYEWTNGTTDVLSYNFVIRAQETELTPVAIPTVLTKNFIYDGYVKALTYVSPVSPIDTLRSCEYFTVTGNKGVDAGRYTVTLSLTDPTKAIWSDGSTDDVKMVFTIAKAQIDVPAADTRDFVFNQCGSRIFEYSIADSSVYTISNNVQENAGHYDVIVALNDTKNYEWSDGSVDNLSYSFVVNKEKVYMPVANDSVFVYNGKYQSYTLPMYMNHCMDVARIANNYQKEAGRYEVKLSLYDTRNFEWEDGSVDDLSYNFVIRKQQVEMPDADPTKFIYNEKEQAYKIVADTRYTVEGNKQTLPGKHEVLVSLKDAKNYEWTNGTTEPLSYNFVIRAQETELKTISIPTVLAKTFVYDGKSKSLAIASSKDYTVTGNKGVDAGRYTVTLALTDPTKTIWSDGSVDDVKIVMTIAKAQIEIPSANATKFTYNGKYQEYYVKDSSVYSISNNIQKNAGRYSVAVALNDAKNYEWSDGSVDDVVYNFVINKAQVKIPAADESKFVYNGKAQTYKIEKNLNYVVEGATQTMPGKYEVLVSLVDAKNYEWENGTTEKLSYSFVIRAEEIEKKVISIPVVHNNNFIYDHCYQWLDIEYSKDVNISGNYAREAGRYFATLSLVDPVKTVWSDGSTDDIKVAYTIAKAQVKRPAASDLTFIYDGDSLTYPISYDYDTDCKGDVYPLYSVTNNTQLNAGRYNVKVSLMDAKNYEWEDGSVDDLSYSFVIRKQQVDEPVADLTKFIYNGKAQTYKIEKDYRYIVEGATQTMPGKHEVLVSLVDPKNYEWTNGTTEPLSYNFVIRAEETDVKSIVIPNVLTKKFIYDGKVKSLAIASSKDYTITGNRGINAGRYTVTLSLTDPVKTVWSDGSTDDVVMTFTIAKAQVEIPAADAHKFVYNNKAQIYTLPADTLYEVSGNVQRAAGRYDVNVSLVDAKNYEWSDGTVDDIVYNFVINKAQVEIPAADASKFVYNGDVQTYKLPTSTLYTIEGNRQTKPGKYEVLVSLKDTKNYEWTNGTTEALSYNFVIRAEETEKNMISIPNVLVKNFVYDGTTKSLAIASNPAYKISGNMGVDAGRYIVTLSLTDPTKAIWSDGSTDDVVYAFTIAKAQIEIPSANATKFTYNGKYQTYYVKENKAYTISNNVERNAGRYNVTVALKNAKNYEWSDGSVDDVVYNFVINKAQVEIPDAVAKTYVYNRREQTYKLVEDTAYTVSGNKHTNAGYYIVSAELNDTKNYMWTDGTADVQKYSFVIEREQVAIPASDNTVYVFDGKPKTYKIATDTRYKIDGATQTMPGKYEVRVSLANANYEWNDGTTGVLSYNFVIRFEESEKTLIDIPTVLTKNFIYDGKAKSLAIASSKDYTISGNEGVDAGRYNVTLSLTDPVKTVWSDGSTKDIVMTFTIAKAKVEIPAANTRKFVYNNKAQVYSLPDDTLYEVSGNVQKEAGRYDVNVSLVDAKNYEWSDGTVDDIVYNFVINKAQVEIPVADQSKFVYNGDAQVYNIPDDSRYIISKNVQKNAGRYNVNVSLLNAKNYEWTDGTVDDLVYSFVISKAQVEIPAADQSKFVYNGNAQTYKLDVDPRYTIEGATQKMPGMYEVIVRLVDTKNTQWVNGTIDDLSYNFVIRAEEIIKNSVEIPNVLVKNFIYDGTTKSLAIPSSKAYEVTGNAGVNVGRYSVKLSLTDKENSVWADGVTDDIIMTFLISKAQVEIPVADAREFVYNGENQTYNIPDDSRYIVKNNVQMNVGNHDVVVSLKDTKNYEWSDGTIGDIVYSFLIVKKEVKVRTITIPVVENTKFIYDAKSHTLDIPESEYYKISGSTKTNAGKYVATISLNDKDTLVWEDGSKDDIVIPYVINKQTVAIPAADPTEYVYTGKNQIYVLPKSTLYEVKGDTQALVGRHMVTVHLKDLINFMWSDGTSNDLQYEFVIKLQDVNIRPIAIPVVSKSNFIYNGLAQGLDITASPDYTILNNSEVKAGSYTAKISLNDKEHTSWEDGTTADIVIPFTIAKAKVVIPSADSARFVYNGGAQTYPVALNPMYTISGNTNINAGNYQAMVALNDKTNTVWENGSSDDILLPYSIVKVQLEKPSADSTSFVYNKDTMTVDIPTNVWYNISGDREAKAGKYAATVSLKDKANTSWNDGTTDDVVIPFSIAKAPVVIPAVDTTEFIYSGDTMVYQIAANELYTVRGNAQSMIGRYSVVVSLNDIENYSWSDGSTHDLIYPFIINEREIVMKLIARPVADTTALVYNGKDQEFRIDADTNCIINGNVRMNAGRYLATVSLADRMTMAWEDGTTDDIIIPFVIVKSQVEKPAADTTVYEFTGEPQTYKIPADSLYTVDGNVQTYIGRYDVFVSLVDINNYEWTDGTTGDLTYRFAINHPTVKDTVNPEDVKVPGSTIEAGDTVTLYEKPGDYMFDIKFDSLAHEQGFEDLYAVPGDSGISFVVPEDAKPGNYTANVTINDIDGSVINKEIEFSVSYPSVMIKRLMNDVLTVDNTNNEFVSYQWYKNGQKIEGANKQFYCDLDGIRGVYKVQIVNIAGDTLFIAEREFAAVIPPFNVTLSKNPVNVNETVKVIIEGVTSSDILSTSSLVVYDIHGVTAINKVGIEKINEISLGNIGEYIVVVRIAGGQTISKHLLVK